MKLVDADDIRCVMSYFTHSSTSNYG